MTTAAILGAHGQIARGLVEHLPHEWDLRLFSRRPDAGYPEAATRDAPLRPYDAFASAGVDLVINAAGPGDPGTHRTIGAEIFRVTETFDNLALDYLAAHPDTAYFNLSTGALCDADGDRRGSRLTLDLDDLARANPYVLAKLNAEAKHRNLPDFRIADLRVFGYFSRHIDLRAQFFAAQAVAHLFAGHEFHTHPADFVRDYVSPDDLAGLIATLYESGTPIRAVNALSAQPVTKFGILDALHDRYGLRFSVDGGEPDRLEEAQGVSAGDGAGIGFCPKLTSAQIVLRETEALYHARERAPEVTIDGND